MQDFLVYLRSCQKNNVSSARDKLILYCQLLHSEDYKHIIQATSEERFRAIIFLVALYWTKFDSENAMLQLQQYIEDYVHSHNLMRGSSE